MQKAYQLSAVDAAVVAAYLAGIVLLGLFVSRRRATKEEFFLASRRATWPVIGLSLIASNISASTLVGLAGAAYASGISVYDYEWSAAVVIVFSCAFVMPAVLKSRVFTLPEFMERRYAPFVRIYFSGLSIFLNIALDCAGALFAGSVLFQLLCPGAPLWLVASGPRRPDGALCDRGRAQVAALHRHGAGDHPARLVLDHRSRRPPEAGGWGEIVHAHPPFEAQPAAAGRIRRFPGRAWCSACRSWASTSGAPTSAMVQRILSARSLDHARWGGLLAGLLKLPSCS